MVRRAKGPLLEGKLPVDDKPAAYVCRDRTCGRPALTEDQLQLELSAR